MAGRGAAPSSANAINSLAETIKIAEGRAPMSRASLTGGFARASRLKRRKMKTKIKLPLWIRTGVILTAIIAGLSMASLTLTELGHLMDSLEPQELRNCVESGGKFIGDRPMPEGLVKVIVQQCHKRIVVESIIRRSLWSDS